MGDEAFDVVGHVAEWLSRRSDMTVRVGMAFGGLTEKRATTGLISLRMRASPSPSSESSVSASTARVSCEEPCGSPTSPSDTRPLG